MSRRTAMCRRSRKLFKLPTSCDVSHSRWQLVCRDRRVTGQGRHPSSLSTMAAHDQQCLLRRRVVIAAAVLTLVLALSAPHLAFAQSGATTTKTSTASSPAATTRKAQTSLAAATIVSSAAGSTTKAATNGSITTTTKSNRTTIAAATRATNATAAATSQTTKPATSRTTNPTAAATSQTTKPATTRTTNATTAATSKITKPATTRTTNATTTPTTNAATTRTTTVTRTNTTIVNPTTTTTQKVFASTSGGAAQTTPKPNAVLLPRTVIDGLTGGCVNVTGSRSRMPKKHVDVMVDALITYMKTSFGTDALNTSYHPLVAGSVRLGFHACANGTCGGCLNVNNPANNGLNFTINALSDFLRQLKAYPPFADCNISYADLWQAAASTALQISLFDNSGTKYNVPIVFGRTDCRTAPYTDDIIPYPDRRDTIDKVLSFFKVRFGLTPREVVALIGGGHSLGVTRDMGTSAIKGQWDHNPDSANTDFYGTLINQTKVWLPTPINYTNIAHPIYSFSKNQGLIFLTPDFSLARNITLKDETTGEPACQLDACPFSSTYADVVFYSKNATNWAQTFSIAYTRMTTAGYAPGQLQAPV